MFIITYGQFIEHETEHIYLMNIWQTKYTIYNIIVHYLCFTEKRDVTGVP